MSDQLQKLIDALEEARARPNPLVPFIRHSDMGGAAATAYSFGARLRKNRFGVGGAWVGYDYYTPDGQLVMESMSSFGYRDT